MSWFSRTVVADTCDAYGSRKQRNSRSAAHGHSLNATNDWARLAFDPQLLAPGLDPELAQVGADAVDSASKSLVRSPLPASYIENTGRKNAIQTKTGNEDMDELALS